ncbi:MULTISPECIES: helix-turn-helix transcriptional regulator [Streptomyces]|uniref:Response regulator transcription factor n=1 Tax=Streptomyces morookaense TaxID=1970 RepID=A0A7Y7E4Z9_STRMO|nr:MULTISPECIES: response regulator transcription factor [Streptomyces]MCC2276953.1 response regulator transcription factor [Streptomyces sp. ET3-23]NVK76110.1 response regulator transcription factor [Streptomyces morookaense]GHF37432.1 hypothetical protein GCM10010359_45110 [Streptomyces morookaense]
MNRIRRGTPQERTVVGTGHWPHELRAAVEDALRACLAEVDADHLAGHPESFARLTGAQTDPWLLLGTGLTDGQAVAVADSACSAVPACRIAVLGPPGDEARTERWMRRGCDVYLAEGISADRLTTALTVASSGLLVIDRHCRRSPAARSHGLSRRERQVLALLCAGLSNADMAASLHVSRRTVEFHLTRIFGKLGVTNRVEAALRAYEAEW